MADQIVIRGAREHNLRDIDVTIPRNSMVVLTGLSGSGKSSLAFDTIYAEGQRRYVESLSAYARQFMDQVEKPDVDSIEGLSPSVAIEQKTSGRNPRSTVGTVTEVYDFMRLLFANVGRPFCYGCDREISAQSVGQIVDRVMALPPRTRIEVLAPVVRDRKGEYRKELADLRRRGFVRARIDGEMVELDSGLKLARQLRHTIEVVVDRLVARKGIEQRLTDSVEVALRLADGNLVVRSSKKSGDKSDTQGFSQRHACSYCDLSWPEVVPRMFSFNSPQGACPSCNGLGRATRIDFAKLIADPTVSLENGALPAWNKRLLKKYASAIRSITAHFGSDASTPFGQLPDEAREMLLTGSAGVAIHSITAAGKTGVRPMRSFPGIVPIIERRYRESESDFVRSELERYMSENSCEDCGGTRLRIEARHVRIGGKGIHEVCAMSISDALSFFSSLKLTAAERRIAKMVLREVEERLGFLADVGLVYLSLDRAAASLSGGESQRIRLATQIGAGLSGVLYVLDEPSIGLHPRDNGRLLKSLRGLTEAGNSVIVVEHDADTMIAADHVIDMGPGAGRLGGTIVAEGTAEELKQDDNSLTGAFLSGREAIVMPDVRRPGNGKKLCLLGASANNLDEVDVEFPLGTFTCVTGVSGSGKSSLVIDTLHAELARRLHNYQGKVGAMKKLEGVEAIDKVIDIDQAPIGRSPRSNPSTYTGLFSDIRALFAGVPEARMRGYEVGRFSFNVKGGRCEACAGDGLRRVEMHFLPDVFVTCDVCSGKRYNRETLQVRYKGRTVANVLDMTVAEALGFFEAVPTARRKLETLAAVGLDYVHLGQPANTLSGGEAQRIKLAKELARTATGSTFYILDEPTTGLHFADVRKLLEVLNRLVEAGNTVVVIEHHVDVIKAADHVIDLGPDGGDGGGRVVVTGTPEQVVACSESHTGKCLAQAGVG